MGGYIGAKSGVGLVNTTLGSVQDLTATDASPEVTLINSTHEDTDGGREGKVIFKGQQSGGEESTLAEIQASHDGTADDEKGDLIFRTNDGSDGASPTERLRIDSAGAIIPATLGTDNVHLGEGAGAAIASGGNYNVTIGKDAGTALTTGDNNVAVGFEALSTEDANGNSTAIGYRALKTQNAGAESYNVAVGVDAGTAVTTATNNTLIGGLVGDALTSGSANVAIGGGATYAALGSDTQGKHTTAIRFGALRAQNFTSNTASNNVAVGYFAGGVMTTGTGNTFLGALAGDDCVDGNNNTVVGNSALSADAGNNNTAIGESALTSTTGLNNTAIGAGAANAITTGTKNTVVGMYTGNQHGVDIRTENNNVVISDGDGQLRLHCDFHNRQKMVSSFTTGNCAHYVNQGSSGIPEGIRVQLTGTAPNTQNGHFFNCGDTGSARCVIDLNGNLRNATGSYGGFSDLKLKENIADASSQWDDIKALKVKKFSMKSDESDTANRIGVIAQDLDAAGMSGLVSNVPDRDPDTGENLGTETKSVKYSILYMKAVKALQEAMARIETLEAQNTTQETQIADLITRVTALEAE